MPECAGMSLERLSPPRPRRDGLDIRIADRNHVTRDDVSNGFVRYSTCRVDLVLPAHGEPTDRAALERVLS